MILKSNLMEWLPVYYQDSLVVQAIMNAENIEMDALYTEINDVLQQCFIETATWGLDDWEKAFGFTPDPTRPYAERRSRLKARLRGNGSITLDAVNDVATSFINGEVNVIEDFTHYKLTIKFVGRRGIPLHLEELKKSLREMIPAHLQIGFEFTFLYWDEFDTQTWDSLEGKNLDFDTLEVTFF